MTCHWHDSWNPLRKALSRCNTLLLIDNYKKKRGILELSEIPRFVDNVEMCHGASLQRAEPLQHFVTPLHELAQFLAGEDVLREHGQIDHLLDELRALVVVLFVEDAGGERVVAVDD